ncbi:MAG: fluoride efflux transporter CrcB [Chloroflexi bacterium]|nr:fluoride efflux transporter CrcB [Chloroflexota bacterium]
MPITLINVLLVGAGGFIGSALRFIVGTWVMRTAGTPVFPYGTLTVNILGCLVIGLLAGLTEGRQLFSNEVRLLVFFGVLGGFTTFSAFGLETVVLLQDGRVFMGLANAGVQVIVCLTMVWIGLALGRALPSTFS